MNVLDEQKELGFCFLSKRFGSGAVFNNSKTNKQKKYRVGMKLYE